MPPHPSDAEPRPPADFAPLLATTEPVLLVGGQAVSLWALEYQDRAADLAPFVSRDADVLGDRDTLEALGKLAGAKPQFFPLKPPSNEVGVVIAKDVHGSPMQVEVLGQVRGATKAEWREPAYTLAIGASQGTCRCPDPLPAPGEDRQPHRPQPDRPPGRPARVDPGTAPSRLPNRPAPRHQPEAHGRAEVY